MAIVRSMMDGISGEGHFFAADSPSGRGGDSACWSDRFLLASSPSMATAFPPLAHREVQAMHFRVSRTIEHPIGRKIRTVANRVPRGLWQSPEGIEKRATIGARLLSPRLQKRGSLGSRNGSPAPADRNRSRKRLA
jgi:hypothetical protein